MTAVPVSHIDGKRILQILEKENGVTRLGELADRVGADRAELYDPLMRLPESGEVAIFPVGDSVQIRSES